MRPIPPETHLRRRTVENKRPGVRHGHAYGPDRIHRTADYRLRHITSSA
jgi:hypothetical protein